jgi:hypothetical protein
MDVVLSKIAVGAILPLTIMLTIARLKHQKRCALAKRTVMT